MEVCTNFKTLRRGVGASYLRSLKLQVLLLPAVRTIVAQRSERWPHSSRLFRPQKASGVVKVRVTSHKTKQSASAKAEEIRKRKAVGWKAVAQEIDAGRLFPPEQIPGW